MLCRKPVSAPPTSFLSVCPARNVNQIPFQNMFSLCECALAITDYCTDHNDDDNAVKGTTPAFNVGVKTSPETSFCPLWFSLSSKDWQPRSVATQYFVNFSFSALIINSLNAHFGLFSTWSKWLEYNAFTLLLISHPLVAEPAWLQDSWGTKWKSWSYWYLLF